MRPKRNTVSHDGIFYADPRTRVGIENLEIKNKCLMSKWLYRLET